MDLHCSWNALQLIFAHYVLIQLFSISNLVQHWNNPGKSPFSFGMGGLRQGEHPLHCSLHPDCLNHGWNGALRDRCLLTLVWYLEFLRLDGGF